MKLFLVADPLPAAREDRGLIEPIVSLLGIGIGNEGEGSARIGVNPPLQAFELGGIKGRDHRNIRLMATRFGESGKRSKTMSLLAILVKL